MNSFLQSVQDLHTDAFECVSVCAVLKPVEDVVVFLEDQLSRIHRIHDPVRRGRIRDRVDRLLCKIREKITPISALFFVDGNHVHEYELDSKHISIAVEYKMMNPYYKTGEVFCVDYFKDFFTCTEYHVMVAVHKNGKTMTARRMTRTKEKSWSVDSIHEDIRSQSHDGRVFVVGAAATAPWMVPLEKPFSREEFYAWLDAEKARERHALLARRLADLQNPKTNLGLYVFGKLRKEILTAIENYELKELYIDSKKLERLERFAPHGSLNFSIIPIDTLKADDIAAGFLRDYNGLMGIRYY